MKNISRVSFAVAATLASAAAQGIGTSGPGQIIRCQTTADADMSAAKTAAGFYFDHRSSNGTAYSQDCNPSYTVDILVAGSYTIPGIGNAITVSGAFDPSVQLTETNCSAASEVVLIYKRSSAVLGSWGPWQLVKAQTSHGVWVPFVDIGIAPYCALSAPLRVVAPPQSFALDQYRVMVQPKLFGAPAAARVDWEWSY
jgi:hypothetical protein